VHSSLISLKERNRADRVTVAVIRYQWVCNKTAKFIKHLHIAVHDISSAAAQRMQHKARRLMLRNFEPVLGLS
jgi:hypothetical protein